MDRADDVLARYRDPGQKFMSGYVVGDISGANSDGPGVGQVALAATTVRDGHAVVGPASEVIRWCQNPTDDPIQSGSLVVLAVLPDCNEVATVLAGPCPRCDP